MWATFAGGRLDGSSQVKASASPPVRFFTPASWAFSVWAPIFLGESGGSAGATIQLSLFVWGEWGLGLADVELVFDVVRLDLVGIIVLVCWKE